MNILGTISVIQKSQDGTTKTVDQHAERLAMGATYRYSYMEKSGAHVLLDITGNQVALRRRDQGLTQAVFDLDNTTEMSVHSEHGIVKFDIEVLRLDIEETSLSIEYNMLHQGEILGQHKFNMNWKVG